MKKLLILALVVGIMGCKDVVRSTEVKIPTKTEVLYEEYKKIPLGDKVELTSQNLVGKWIYFKKLSAGYNIHEYKADETWVRDYYENDKIYITARGTWGITDTHTLIERWKKFGISDDSRRYTYTIDLYKNRIDVKYKHNEKDYEDISYRVKE